MNMVRSFAEKKYSKFLLMLLVFAFVLSSLSGIIFMTNKYNIVVVDDKKININEYINILNYQRQMAYNSTQDAGLLNYINTKEYMVDTLNKLFTETLISKSVEDLKIVPSDDIILQSLVNNQNFKTNDRFDLNKFNSLINLYGMTDKDYINFMKKQGSEIMLHSFFINKMDMTLISNIISNYNNIQKNVSIYKINKNDIKIDSIDLDDKALKDYYNANVNDFIIPETRKIDYVILGKDIDKKSIEEYLLTSFDIEEFAKNLNLKVESYGYLTKDELPENELATYNINDLSELKYKDDNYYIYSVVDIKAEKIRTFDEAKEEVKKILEIQNRENEYKKVVNEYRSDMDSLLSRGFIKENDKINRNYNKYGKDFTDNVLRNNVSDVFVDDNYIFFAVTESKGVVDNPVSITKEELNSQFSRDIKKDYLNYLVNEKYKTKVNYELLDLIKNA